VYSVLDLAKHPGGDRVSDEYFLAPDTFLRGEGQPCSSAAKAQCRVAPNTRPACLWNWRTSAAYTPARSAGWTPVHFGRTLVKHLWRTAA